MPPHLPMTQREDEVAKHERLYVRITQMVLR